MKRQTMIQIALLLLLAAVTAACMVNPVTGKKELSLLSEEEEVAMGEQYYPVMTQMSGGVFQDKDLEAYVNEVGKKLVAVSHRPDLPYRFNVVNTSEVNAYALPAGKITITRGLISRMENESQLAAVLGHEIGHVTARHVSEAISRQILTQTAVAGLSIYLQHQEIKNAEYYSMAGMVGAQLMMLKFSRDNERQSDELGMDYMIKAGYDPQGMVQLQEILQAAHEREPNKLQAFFQTHPMTSARIETARTRIAAFSPPPGGEMHGKRFERRSTKLQQVAGAYKLYDQGLALMAEKKYQAAVSKYEQAISLQPDQALFHADLGAVYTRLNQSRKARQSLNQALRLYPDLFQSLFYSATHHLGNNRWQRALNEFSNCDGLIPEQPGVKYHQAFCHENLGQRQQAVALYQKVISLDPQGQYGAQAGKRLQALGVRP